MGLKNTVDKLYDLPVISNIEISPDTYVLSFERRFDFDPGQVVKVAVDDREPPRIYSICSGNKDHEMQILFNVKREGYLTPRIASLIPGDTIKVSKPYGGFTGNREPAWWIATGTGVAPFRSMLNSGLGEGNSIIHGVRYLNQFYFEDEIEATGVTYIKCCSGESSCDVVPGRVTSYLAGIEQLPDVNYYLCGKASMVVEVRDLLISKGVSFDKIFAEIYF